MTTCAKCGAEITDDPHAHRDHRPRCAGADACALRAELRIVKAERDALLVQVADWCAAAEDDRLLREKIALHERRQVIFEESDRDLRAAVLAVAATLTQLARSNSSYRFTHSSLATRLRKACGEKP